MIKGIIFDMDGILFDTESLFVEADLAAAKKQGFDLTMETIYKQIGTNSGFIKKTFCDAMGPGLDYQQFLYDINQYCSEHFNTKGVPIKKGVEKTLEWLQNNDFTMVIASSTDKPTIEYYLKKTSFDKYFSAIVSGDMIKASKPAPDIFLRAIEEIGLGADQCLAVEDSYNGVRSASSAGCLTVMIPDLLPATPEMMDLCHAVLESMEELPALIQKISNKYT